MRKLKQLIILSVCLIFIAAGAVNQGVSGFLWSLPFVVAFIYVLRSFSVKAKIALMTFAATLIVPLAWKHEENKIIYPWIDSAFTATCAWEAIKYERGFTGYDYATLVPKGAEVEEQYVISRHVIPCDVDWKLTRVFVRHPNLGTLYYPVFSIAGYEATMSGYELDDAIKSQTLSHSQIHSSYELQSEWTNSLSLLMMWAAIPIQLLTGVMSFFAHTNV